MNSSVEHPAFTFFPANLMERVALRIIRAKDSGPNVRSDRGIHLSVIEIGSGQNFKNQVVKFTPRSTQDNRISDRALISHDFIQPVYAGSSDYCALIISRLCRALTLRALLIIRGFSVIIEETRACRQVRGKQESDNRFAHKTSPLLKFNATYVSVV